MRGTVLLFIGGKSDMQFGCVVQTVYLSAGHTGPGLRMVLGAVSDVHAPDPLERAHNAGSPRAASSNSLKTGLRVRCLSLQGPGNSPDLLRDLDCFWGDHSFFMRFN